jgi:uncharacterized protein (DUF433 family)
MREQEQIDWSACHFVEIKPGIQGGVPVLLGTLNFDYGVSVAEIAEQFELDPEQIEHILEYAKSHRIAHRV